jgi:regulator of cell morphogenesis and NO signaling
MDKIGNTSLLGENFLNKAISDIVKENFKTAAVFEKYHLDFCCRGNKPLNEACSEKGLDAAMVADELTNLKNGSHSADNKCSEWELDFLVDYIVNNHHHYVKQMIPVISTHTNKIARVHGENHPETIEIAKKFSVVYKELKQHMMKEEEILFPFIKQLVKFKERKTAAEAPYFGSVKNPIKMMELEHQAAGDEFFEIRELTNNYTPPGDACNTYRICYKELKEFEEDLHKHIYLENNILFPKSIELEKQML